MSTEQLAVLGHIKKFETADYICIKGKTANQMFVVLSGQVGIYSDTNGEKIAFLTAGDFFGEMGMVDDLPLDFTAKAETPVLVLTIPIENFHKLVNARPDLADKIIETMGRRIRALETALVKNQKPSPGWEKLLLKSVFPQKFEIKETKTEKPETALKYEETQKQMDIFGILPADHGNYDLRAKDTDKDFYYQKLVSCPLCENEFTTTIPRMTKLRLEKRENDLRETFKDFDPLWYAVRTCPCCLFAKYHGDFDKTHRLSERGLKSYREKAISLAGKVSLPSSEPLTINRVFLDYYLALFFAEIENTPLTMAKLYMSLSWLYQDVGDEILYNYSWNKAFEYYHKVYYETNLSGLNPSHEQQLCIVLGELYYRKGESAEALKHFYAAIRQEDGINYYTKLARDRYMEIKEEIMN